MVGTGAEEATTETDAETYDNEVRHTVGTAKGVFTQCRDMSIVG